MEMRPVRSVAVEAIIGASKGAPPDRPTLLALLHWIGSLRWPTGTTQK
jgi:hypothetical protein